MTLYLHTYLILSKLWSTIIQNTLMGKMIRVTYEKSHLWQGWPDGHPENETSSPLICCCVWLEKHHSLCKQICSPVIINMIGHFSMVTVLGPFQAAAY